MALNDNIWHVELSNGKIGKFDAAMLCTGHHCEPLIPEIPGLINFKGQVLHAKQYSDYKGFEGKRVFILGIGNSALDIGVELAKIAKNVIISTRRGTWVFNRVIQNGLPYDVVYQSRFYQWMMSILPWTIANDFHEHRMQQRMDHDMYGLRPAHRFFQQHPAVNDSLANLLASGQITIANDISSIGEHSICVKDGREFGTDVLILCTGYTFGFPFIDPPELIPTKSQNDVDLYKYVFPPSNCVAKRLAVIGLVQPIGSVAPIAEMQARWAAAIFSARLELPDEAEMRVNIARTRATMRRQYFESSKHTLQVPFIPYMDELAELVGCMPNIKKISFLVTSGFPGAIDKMPKRKCKGLVDNWFNYGITKCFALYFGVLFTVGLWLCVRSDGYSSTMFIIYNILISLITSWPMFVQSVPFESMKLIVKATLMIQENSKVAKFVNLIVELGYVGLVRLLEEICTQKVVTTNGKLRTLWCQIMKGYLTDIGFEKRIVPHISMRPSARKSAQQRQEFENLEIDDEMPLRKELFWQAQRVGAALLYTLIYGEMKELVDRKLDDDKPPKQDNSNNSDEEEAEDEDDEERFNNAYIQFWVTRVERAFRKRFEAESEIFLKELDKKISWRDFGPIKKSISEWKKMIELMGH
uniref:Flavin-containing monooxygenase n=1 Tax=Globodera pallida TaxID=36090 RepID=A0A183BWH2_GLOPA